MEVYEHKGYTFHRVGCHECTKGGNGSGECEAGGNITDMDMQDAYLPVRFMEMVIDDMPTIEAEPVKHGEWVYGEFDIPHCSECGKEVLPCNISPYCPNCGAKMEEN